ncbi:MAG: energy transducer TonB [Bacteroidota bacterium]
MSNRTLFVILISFGIIGGLTYMKKDASESVKVEKVITVEVNKELEVIKEIEEVEVIIKEAVSFQEPKILNFKEVVNKIGYPESAKESGIEGQVLIKVLVNEQGNYKFHKIVSSEHTILTNAVEMHVDELQFSPAQQDGQKVQAWVSVPFVFNLN